MSTIRSVTLNDVSVPASTSSGQTHIVIYHDQVPEVEQVDEKHLLIEMKQQIDRLVEEVERLNAKMEELQANKSTPFFGAEVAPAPCGLNVWRMSSMPSMPSMPFSSAAECGPCDVDELPPAHSMLQVLINKLPSSAMDEEEEEPASGEEEEEEEEEKEEEGEALELEEIEYKGVTYYKDPDGQVYQKDDDGDLDDTPIGIWNEAKQKIQKYAKEAKSA